MNIESQNLRLIHKMKLKTKKNTLNIPVTNMADIAYLLLIFIIILSLFNKNYQSGVELPISTGSEFQDKGNQLVITQKDYLLNDLEILNIRTLKKELLKIDKSKPVKIIADRELDFSYIRNTLSVLKELKFNKIEFLVSD